MGLRVAGRRSSSGDSSNSYLSKLFRSGLKVVWCTMRRALRALGGQASTTEGREGRAVAWLVSTLRTSTKSKSVGLLFLRPRY